MAYVKRDQDGNIVAVFDVPQQDANEALSINSEELIAFLSQSSSRHHARTALNVCDTA